MQPYVGLGVTYTFFTDEMVTAGYTGALRGGSSSIELKASWSPYVRLGVGYPTASSSVRLDDETQIELRTYGRRGDLMGVMHTLLVGKGNGLTRPLKWLVAIARHPLQWLKSLWPFGWSRYMVTLLVMQAADNAIALRPKRRLLAGGWRVVTQQHRAKLNPTYIAVANQAAQWLAQHTPGASRRATSWRRWQTSPPRPMCWAVPSSVPTPQVA